jgi:hypothetical protein
MHSRRDTISGNIYLSYLLHYIAHWPVTAVDLRNMARDHGFAGFANFFDSLPKRQCFGCPDEVRLAFDVARPQGEITGFDADIV